MDCFRSQKLGVLGFFTGVSAALTGCAMFASSSPPPVAVAQSDVQIRADQGDQSPIEPGPSGTQFRGRSPEASTQPFDTRLLSNLTQHTFTASGEDFDPDIAPDGRLMVFASTRNAERPDIFLKSVDGLAITQITSDGGDDIQPRFSPDGKRIAFCSNRAGNWDIWVVNADGMNLMQITSDRADEVAPDWSPDGTRIAFTVWGRQSRQWEIWTVSLAEPGVRRFLAYGMFPTWSPDGKRLAFQRARRRDSRWFSIWTVEIVGNEVRHPTEIAYSDEAACIAPQWAPDGKTLVYCQARPAATGATGSFELWAVAADTGARLKLTDGAYGALNPAWSSDGRIYFVSAQGGSENIWSMATEPEGFAAALGTAATAPRSSGAAAVGPPAGAAGEQ